VFYGDLLDKASLTGFFSVPDTTEIIVIHCAGIVSTSMRASKRLYDVNVGGTKKIVDLCLQKQVRKLLYVSSIHAMPTLPPGQMMTEIDDFDPDKVVGPYAKTKAEATAYVSAPSKTVLKPPSFFPADSWSVRLCQKQQYHGSDHQLLQRSYAGRPQEQV
jgi:dihydroflavonol-4-reductase